MIVRRERRQDYEAIAAVVGAAFGDEPAVVNLVDAIRASPEYKPEFALVADDGREIVGHVMLSELPVGSERALQLSPLAVRPDRQRQGIGSLLVNVALDAARAAGETLVCVEGNPRYYGRFGFVRADEIGIERPNERVPEWAFQAIAFTTQHPRGRAVYPPAFDVVE